MIDCDVVVIGAGMAGLAAARVLAEAGMRIIVLEAQPRIGGRIRTLRDGDVVIELGAEFVHGRPPELWDLIAEAKLKTYERTGNFLYRTDAGLISTEQDDDDDPLEALKDFAGPDCSFAAYLENIRLPEHERQQQIGYVEGFNAADAQQASAMALGLQQRAEDTIDGERSWRIAQGYDKLPDFLLRQTQAAGGQLVTDAEVAAVQWVPGAAEIQCSDGRIWHANKVVVAVPLGILQTGAICFTPELPQIAEAASLLRMGHACRFTMVFSRRIWPEQMSFLLTPGLLPGVWWTARPAESRSLTGWVGGPRSLQLNVLNDKELRQRAIAAMALALALSEDEIRAALTGFHRHDWDTDPWTHGAYTWVPVGGLEASAKLCKPVAATLYFAGEHTDTTGHWGTVHAALRSGLRAARQILSNGYPLP